MGIGILLRIPQDFGIDGVQLQLMPAGLHEGLYQLCGLFDEINIPVDTYGDIKEGTFEFNNVSYKDLMLDDEVVYRLPGNCTFIISSDIVK